MHRSKERGDNTYLSRPLTRVGWVRRSDETRLSTIKTKVLNKSKCRDTLEVREENEVFFILHLISTNRQFKEGGERSPGRPKKIN